MTRLKIRRLLWTVPLLAVAGCAGKPDLPSGPAAYTVIPAVAAGSAARSYTIGPFDTIAITVFQEPDLSVRGLQVDAAGKVIIPLVGEIQAGGKTSTELALHISELLSHFLERPQVAVIVQDSVSQKVTVEGSVLEAGVYQIKGRTTLLDAIAMAKGTSRVAALNEVAVFRMINGKRTGALFDIGRIHRGLADDPEILGSDVVVVGLSNIREAWLDILSAAPLVTATRP